MELVVCRPKARPRYARVNTLKISVREATKNYGEVNTGISISASKIVPLCSVSVSHRAGGRRDVLGCQMF